MTTEGVMEEKLLASIKDCDWSKTFQQNHNEVQELFTCLAEYRKHDVHRLLRKLEDIHRRTSPMSENKASMTGDVSKFISVTVRTYCHCIENIKLARSVEKFLADWSVTKTQDIITEFEFYITEVMSQHHTGGHQLNAISYLLDQSRYAREIIQQRLSKFLLWLLQQFESIIRVKEQEKELELITCANLKIVLQLFQSCPSQTCHLVWKKENEDCTTLKKILELVFMLLKSEESSTDVIMLSGTVVGFFLSSAGQEDIVYEKFWAVFNNNFTESSKMTYEEIMFKNKKDMKTAAEEWHQLGVLSLIKGILGCATSEILGFKITENEDPFCIQLFTIVHGFCIGPAHLRYHAFSLLLLWFTKFVKLISNYASVCHEFVNSCLIDKTLDIIWMNWDSPVEDVSELASESLKCLFEAYEIINKTSHQNAREENGLFQSMLKKLKTVPWYTKGRYKVLSALIPYLGSHYISQEYPSLPEELLQCMTTNYLASSSADVYKTMLLNMKKMETDKITCAWEESYLTPLKTGLFSNNVLQRTNICQYWIPSTVKILPHVGQHIQNHFSHLLNERKSQRQQILHAYLTVSKVIRLHQASQIQNVAAAREGLYACDDEIRSEALGVVCVSQKKADPLSEIEDGLLREVIPYNFKVDSAPFRQHLTAHMKKLLTRIRDGSIALIKTADTTTLDISLKFVDWLHTVCVINLMPGACYQRRKTSLEILSILYETLHYNDRAKQRKSFAPESTKKLNEYVQKRKMWEFFSSSNYRALVLCLLDGADDIQELAITLLLNYFPWPSEQSMPNDVTSRISNQNAGMSTACHLMTEMIQLCNSPKAQQCQSGAALCKLIFQKCVIEKGWLFCCDSDNWTCSVHHGEDAVKHFILIMLTRIQDTLKQSQINVVKASKSSPIHGYITAITRCLTECLDIKQIISLYHSLIQINSQVTDTMLRVMGHGSDSQGCPSFAEIGLAVENLILENEEDYSQTASLSGEHQYLLSWCWINIKESCLSLGNLSNVMIHHSDVMGTDLEVIKSIGNVFLRVLTQCRHRGVIEGCRTAFLQFCSALCETKNAELQKIPKDILLESFDSLQNKATSTSTTRKSAGLPVIIQCIITCERRAKKNELMRLTLDQLFAMVQMPLSETIDDRHDLAQVHALNILKCLYGDSSLQESLMGYIGRAVILVVNQFGSPAWTIRNAATRLFSVLITRLFGQKKVLGNQTCNTTSLQELSAYYPELIPYLLQSLKTACERDITAVHDLHPSLFPVLTILSNIGRVDSSTDVSVSCTMKNFVKTLLRSPVYFLRNLSAAAYSSLVPMETTTDTVRELLQCLTTDNVPVNSNYVHGVLVAVEILVKSYTLSFPEVDDILNEVFNKKWLLERTDTLTAQYLRVLIYVYNKSNQKKRAEIIAVIKQNLYCNRQTKGINSQALSNRIAVDFLSEFDSATFFLEIMTEKGVDTDIKLTVIQNLQRLNKKGKITAEMSGQIQDSLLKLLQQELYPPVVTAAISCLTELHVRYGSSQTVLCSVNGLWRSYKPFLFDQGILPSAALEMGSICVQCAIRKNVVDEEDVIFMCKVIERRSRVSEDSKLTVCQCLQIVGGDILSACLRSRTQGLQKAAIRIFYCVMNLVQDDDTDVRGLAVKFISSLDWEHKTHKYETMHCNICVEIWIEYFSHHFCWSKIIIIDLYNRLYEPRSIQAMMKEQKPSKQLFEQEDNSFYSEDIMNTAYLYKTLTGLQKMSAENSSVMDELEISHLTDDVFYATSILGNIDNSIINILCDPRNLNNFTQLVCSVKFALELNEHGSALELSNLKQLFQCLLQHKEFPKACKDFLQMYL